MILPKDIYNLIYKYISYVEIYDKVINQIKKIRIYYFAVNNLRDYKCDRIQFYNKHINEQNKFLVFSDNYIGI